MGLGFQFKSLNKKKQTLAPRNHVPIYVGEGEIKKRFVIPISYLIHPSFRALLSHVEEEFGMGQSNEPFTIPCKEEAFESLILEIKNEKKKDVGFLKIKNKIEETLDHLIVFSFLKSSKCCCQGFDFDENFD